MQRSLRTYAAPRLPAMVAGVLAAPFAAPALAASSYTLQGSLSGFTLREWLLCASLLLLAIALIARLVRGRARRRDTPLEEVPDLRWWRNYARVTPTAASR